MMTLLNQFTLKFIIKKEGRQNAINVVNVFKNMNCVLGNQ